MPGLLKKLGFTSKETALPEAVVSGRLIAPSDELATLEWLRKRSTIGELTESPLDKIGRNAVYTIVDRLLENNNALESYLRAVEERENPSKESLFLFDLTNFYFEGQSLGNSLTARGKSKERRSDAPLISLGLVVDSEGFSVTSKVFPGNIGEPYTFEEVLWKMGFGEDDLPGMRPTLAMDRGIATAENVEMLKKKGFPYVLETTHGDKSAEDIWTLYMTLTKVEKAFRSMKSYWRLSRTKATHHGMTNKWLKDQGLIFIKEQWVSIHYPASSPSKF